jgi:hypothetical protein
VLSCDEYRRHFSLGEQKANVIRWTGRVAFGRARQLSRGASGVRHSVEVTTESLEEGAALARVRRWRTSGWAEAIAAETELEAHAARAGYRSSAYVRTGFVAGAMAARSALTKRGRSDD